MPDDRTIDFVVMFLVFGVIGLGLLSMFVGWVVRTWDRFVNTSQVVMSPDQGANGQTDQTDRQTDQVSVDDQWIDRLEVDRTKTAVIELLVYSGWKVGEIRSVLKGDHGAIGIEVEQARQRLGIDPPDRQLRVRDQAGERVIPI